MAQTAGQRGGDRTILVVDDSASVRKLVELTLRREGYNLVFASSGVTALAALAECEPDLVLLDLTLLAIDGLQICTAIRQHPRTSEIPIVILSGRESEADRQAGFERGVNAYITKPFRPDGLIDVVREQLGVSVTVSVL